MTNVMMGLDQHRAQITAEWLDTETGELGRRRICPADRESFAAFLASFKGKRVEAALEATTGWRFLAEELEAAGHGAHLAEPAETAARRGPKRRAKTDRADARHLRVLLGEGRLPESWIPPEQILELRSLVRLRKALVDERCAWQQRIHAQLYHHGRPSQRDLLTGEHRAWVESLELPEAAQAHLSVALSSVDHVKAQMAPLEGRLRQIAKTWPGPQALQVHYGIGELTAVAIVAELGDVSRFSSSRKVVRYAGLDITVSQSDARRAPGKLSRQGPATLRWALFEAAQVARRKGSPDQAYYLLVKERLGTNRACLAIARKLLKRSYHTLRELGEEALAPA